MDTIYGIKTNQTQRYNSAGKRIPVTLLQINPNIVTQIKTKEKDGYAAIQIMTGKIKKHTKNKAQFTREIKIDEAPQVKQTDQIKPTEVLTPGDIVNVSAVSKGKGFAGVVKRHHFRGGPKTHGQSDRERAPGSIGQTTTPGRVYKGKRMAGRMGGEFVTQRNLTILEVSDTNVIVKGTIPGPLGSLARLTKIGLSKHFQPLLSSTGLDKEAIAQEQAQLAAQSESAEGEKAVAESPPKQN